MKQGKEMGNAKEGFTILNKIIRKVLLRYVIKISQWWPVAHTKAKHPLHENKCLQL